ncbi:MAG: V-type ATP synthase subunit I [Candidatus Hodarchaeota archaeon]
MGKKDEFCLMKVDINYNYKDQLLIELSNLNTVHIKPKEKSELQGEIEEKKPIVEKINLVRKNLDTLFNRLDINQEDINNLRINKSERIEFKAQDLDELINHVLEEIEFFTNRAIELKSYISKAKIELENIEIVKKCYKYLEKIEITNNNVPNLKYFKFRVFTTFSKNLENLINLFTFSEFPNYYETFQISEDRTGFYIFYPKDKEDEFNGRIRLIHSEEVPILKKYLTDTGINYNRIDTEIKFIKDLLSRYNKEQNRISSDNLIKFAGINEIVQNIEEYNWAAQQFEVSSANRTILKFFVPLSKKNIIKEDLFNKFKENILIESIDVSKKRPIRESYKKKEFKKEKLGFKSKSEEFKSKNGKDEHFEDLRDVTPRIMKNIFLAKPFETITKMYGTPTYSEIDPTPIIAFTFPILFGIMFGDIGHGLVLIIAGFIGALAFKKRKKTFSSFSWIIFYCGWASFLIGFFYGEFFGHHEIEIFGNIIWNFEENPIVIPIVIPYLNINVIIQLYNPLGNILSVFYFAITIGIFHIILGWFIQFLNYWKQSRKYLAFSDSLMKIFFLLGGAILIFGYGFNINIWLSYPYPILFVLIPGLLLIFSKPFGKIFKISYLQQESIGGLIGEGSIETFDTLLSVMSNVLSYIRLLALALAHIALLFAINQMGNLIQGVGIGFDILNLIGAIFGNMVVILIEGLLVFINTMRLHYYEFFFKFFQGSGIEYFPFYLDDNYSFISFTRELDRDIISEEIDKEIEIKSVKEEIDKAKSYIIKEFK